MSESRNNPFRGLIDVASEMNRMRQLGRYGYEPGEMPRERTHATAWIPAADIFARGGDLVLRVELAGVSPQDMDITFHDNVLTISGERKRDLEDRAVSYFVHERYHGVFRRSITLPAGVDQDDITADFDNGLVEIIVEDGAARTEPRRIEIRDKSR